MNEIVIGTDGRKSGLEAARYGVDLAGETGASVVFVYVWSAPPAILGEPVYSRAVSAELGKARRAVDDAAALAAEAGVEYETEIVEGDPATRIAGVARGRGAGLIVLGSRRHGALEQILGTVSTRLVRQGPCSVVVVRGRQTAPKQAA